MSAYRSRCGLLYERTPLESCSKRERCFFLHSGFSSLVTWSQGLEVGRFAVFNPDLFFSSGGRGFGAVVLPGAMEAAFAVAD